MRMTITTTAARTTQKNTEEMKMTRTC
jgi:hypothetical protein